MTRGVQRVSWVSDLYHQIRPPSLPLFTFKTLCAHTFPSPYKMAPGEWLHIMITAPGEWPHIMIMTEVPAAHKARPSVQHTWLEWIPGLAKHTVSQPSPAGILSALTLGHPSLPLSLPILLIYRTGDELSTAGKL